jgi:hypothetical protein
MYKPSTYLVIAYFSTYIQELFDGIGYQGWNQILTQLRFIQGHPVDGVLVGASSLWPLCYPYGGTPPTSNWCDYWIPV